MAARYGSRRSTPPAADEPDDDDDADFDTRQTLLTTAAQAISRTAMATSRRYCTREPFSRQTGPNAAVSRRAGPVNNSVFAAAPRFLSGGRIQGEFRRHAVDDRRVDAMR